MTPAGTAEPGAAAGGARHSVGSVLDTVLDRTVVGGYSKVGYRIRHRRWDASGLRRLEGKVVLVTGGTSGLGLAAVGGLARLGATVWLVGRDRRRTEEARARVSERTENRNVCAAICDLSSLSSVRRFVGHFKAEVPRLDVLINNAGVLTRERELSVDGIELTLATNVIGPFLLTNLLIPLLEGSAPARIINVSSGGMYGQRIKVEDLQSEGQGFDGTRAYARTKRAEVILTEMWAERLAASGVVVHAMHPGWVDTAGLRSSLPRFYRATRPLLRSASEGADTIVWLAAADEAAGSSGGFWHDRRRRPTHLLPWTRETAQQRESLWSQCCALSGWRSGQPSETSPNS